MDINKAITILIEGCEIAQSKGAYTLADARQIAEAIDYIQYIGKQNATTDDQDTNPTTIQDDGKL